MINRQTEAAWAYHDATKHSYQSIRANPHHLDWDNQPLPFKIYKNLPAIPLPQDLSSSGVPALAAISITPRAALSEVRPNLQTLAEIFYFSAGITKRRSYAGGEMLFRAAACTGALYHIDLYLVCGDLEGLDAGVYHFSPQDFSLRQLRRGDYQLALAKATGEESAISNASCVIASASTFWRNAWKYQARAYRHCYWDNGTILANLLAASAARNLPAKVVLGFVDATASQLLALDPQREAPLSLVALGRSSEKRINLSPPIEPLVFETVPLSKSEIEYPEMRRMHEASSLQSGEEVAAWRRREEANRKTTEDEGKREDRLFPLHSLSDEELVEDSIEKVITRRGSTREFSRDSITFGELSSILDRASRGITTDFLDAGETLNDLYLIVHAVEGLPSGAYVFRRQQRALELLKAGDFRRDAGYLGLRQEIPADCSVNIYLMADLHRILECFGNRGYRAAQLEAAIMGGKMYLSAYAQRLGASGLTFFDDDVTEFFSPDAAGKSVMFLIAVGKSARRRNRV
ncbi:MAG TPA: SagB/ThcOx family dehydrogenase [Candidatus Binatia bacterium]|nr:SagB/ThcOx family dehydrogenase [Candidatus Binatia bacterium]